MSKSKAVGRVGAMGAVKTPLPLVGAALKQGRPASAKNGSKKKVTPAPSNRLDSLPNHGPANRPEIASNQKVLPAIKSMVERFEDMLEGHLEDLPSKPPSEVRVFLSSTFSDLRAERNLLVQEAYPRLKQFCADLDLDFQLVDMRWGVTDDATNEHITEKLCMQEIRNCQKISLGPNYVVILGDRYGYRPIPCELTELQFNTIMKQVGGQADAKHLTDWYRKDENACPPVYLLQPIKTHLPHFGDYSDGNEELRKRDSATWWQTLQTLQRLFQGAATSACAQGQMSAAEKRAFMRSVTECEVEFGIAQDPDPSQHAASYIRKLDGLDSDALHDSVAARYIDCKTVDDKFDIDEEVRALRENLAERVPILVSPKNSSSYTVKWQMGGVSPTHPEHEKYLRTFCERFVSDLQRLVEQGLHAKKNVIPASNYYTEYEELLHHLHFTQAKCASFRGREDVFEKVKAYLKDGQNRKPLVLHAESGGGKTSVMAMLMRLLPQWFGKDCIRIIRYLGTSPYSQDIYSVLRSISGQLADAKDTLLEPVGVKNMRTLSTYLPRFFRNISRNTKHPIFILLDSIDQLAAKDGAHGMRWLPLELPANINIIISTLPELHGCLDNIRSRLPDEKCYIEVKPLPETTSVDIVDSYLGTHNRVLTAGQRDFILEQMHLTPTPLFLKLLLDQAVLWKSFTPVEEMRVANSVRAAIQQLFEELETKFGETVVSRTLGYITCGLNGLTEVELEDALSCDDETLNEVYQYHNPPIEGIVRLPPVIWVRIKQDIQEYLAERKSFSKKTLYWYHRQFIEAAEDRYTSDENGRLLHQKLASLYGAENGIRRDVTLSKRKLTLKNVDRQVTKQPMVSSNFRMLEALPYHAVNSGDVTLMKSSVLCNLNFMMTRIAAFSLAALIGDVSSAIWTLKAESKSDYDLEILLDTLEAMRPSLKRASSLPAELLGRIQRKPGAASALNELLQQAEMFILNQSQSTLLPLYPCLSSSELIEWVLKDCCALVNTSSSGMRALVTRLDATTAMVDFAAEDTLLSSVDAELGHKGMLQISDDGKFIYSLYKPASGNKNTKSAKNTAVLHLDKWQADRKVDTKTFTYTCTSQLKSTLCYVVDAKNLAVVHDDKFVSVWNQVTQKPLRSCVTFDNFGHFYEAWNLSNGMLLILAAREKLPMSEGEETVTEGGVLMMNMTTRGQESVIVLPRPLARKNLQLCTRRRLLLGHLILEGCTKVVVVDYSQQTYQVITYYGSTVPPVVFLHPISSIALVCEPGGVEIQCHEFVEKSVVNLKFDIEGKISAITMDPDGEHIVTGTTLGDLYVWHYDGQQFVGNQKTETNHITQILITKGEEYLIAVSEDRTLTVWNWKLLLQNLSSSDSDKNDMTMENHLMAYRDASQVGFMEQTLYTIAERTLLFWNVSSATNKQHYEHTHPVIKASPALEGSHLVFSDDAGRLMLFDSATSAAQCLIDKDVKGFTLDAKGQTAYILKDNGKNLSVHIYCLVKAQITRSVTVKGSTPLVNFDLRVNDSSSYLTLAVGLTPNEKDIIYKSEKKNNLKPMSDPTLKFYCINLKTKSDTSTLQICNRILTQVPCLGASWAMHLDNSVIIGRDRIVVLWDMETLKCDQRISKGTKIGMFFRPQWFEDDSCWQEHPTAVILTMISHLREMGVVISRGGRRPRGISLHPISRGCDIMGKVCHGATLCMERSSDGGILAVGSADGYILIYNMFSGLCIQKDEELAKSSHAAPVVKVAASGNSSHVASYSSNRLMKLWLVTNQTSAQEVFSISLPAKVIQMSFTSTSSHLVVLTQTPNHKTQVLLFKVTSGKTSNS